MKKLFYKKLLICSAISIVALLLIVDVWMLITAQKSFAASSIKTIEQMEQNVADTLRIAKNQVNIKATTEEGLGFTGAQEGISANAICSLTGFYEISMLVGGGDRCSGCSGCSRGK